MPTELLLAPVGAGKTEYALKHLHKVIETQPLAPVWVLLPGRRQEDALRQRLVESTQERRIYFNLTFFSFYTLYARLLDMVGQPQRELDETARLLKELGVRYMRTGISWADSFRQNADDWFDQQMNALDQFDVTLTYCFTPEHCGLRPHYTSPPKSVDEFADFCARMTHRYAA